MTDQKPIDPVVLANGRQSLAFIARTLGNLAALDAELQRIGSADNATREALARLDALHARIDLEQRAHTDKITSERAAADAALAEINSKSAQIKADADSAAGRKLKDANDRAETILADAKAKATKIESDVGLQLADRRKALAEANRQLESAKSEIASAMSSLDALKKSHAEVTEQHQSVKAALAALKAKL